LFALDPDRGELLWSNRSFDEPWWLALETTIGDVAVLHRYPRPDRPETLGCVIIDALSGEMLWEDPMGRIIMGDDASLLLQRGEPGTWSDTSIVDARTGSVIHRIHGTVEEIDAYREQCDGDIRWNEWISGMAIDPGSELWDRTLSLVGVDTRAPILAPLEHIEYEEWSATVVHTRGRREGDGITSMLYLRRGMKLVVREKLRTETTPPSGESFFVMRGVLMALCGRETLLGIDLRTPS